MNFLRFCDRRSATPDRDNNRWLEAAFENFDAESK